MQSFIRIQSRTHRHSSAGGNLYLHLLNDCKLEAIINLMNKFPAETGMVGAHKANSKPLSV